MLPSIEFHQITIYDQTKSRAKCYLPTSALQRAPQSSPYLTRFLVKPFPESNPLPKTHYRVLLI